MTAVHTGTVLPQVDDTIGIADLARICAMSREELDELVEYGALQPLTATHPEPVFTMEWIGPLRIAASLRRDYDFDLFAVVIFMDHLRRIASLETRLQRLQAQAGVC